MHKQNVKLILFSSIAIMVMTLAWGVNQIPRQKKMAEQTLKASLEQELLVVSSAVRASTQAMRFKLLDVLKAEGGEKTTRAFQDSSFASVTLLEWDTAQWKSLWHSTKFKDRLQMSDLRLWMKDWPMAKIGPNEAYFVRVGDVAGSAHFAVVIPVRKGNSVMMGVGIFPATEFGMSFSADRLRDVKITDDKGYAISLSRPAYLGVSLRKENLIAAMVDGEEISTRMDWDAESGRMFGVATRMNDSNLIASIETPVNFGTGYLWQSWVYLILCAVGAAVLNFYLFNTMLGPLLQQLAQSDAAIEALKRGISLQSGAGELARAPGTAPVVEPELEDFSFIDAKPGVTAAEEAAPDNGPVRMSLAKVIASAIRSQELNIRKSGIRVQTAGVENIMLTADALQLQTALEEVIKNSVEAMADSEQRVLTILGETRKGRVHLTIEDTGCGVEAVNMARVFDPFFSTKDSEGVSRGLGLNVVRRVIEELKGTVDLTSNGQGTCVEMEWPDANMIVAGSIDAVQPIEEETQAAAATPEFDPSAEELIELKEDDDFEAMILSAPLVPSSKREFNSDLIRKPKVRTLS